MNRRERLMASIRGEAVDRPPVSFYELDGYNQDPADKDRFNIYNDPSWKELIRLTIDKSDRILLCPVGFVNQPEGEVKSLTTREKYYDNDGNLCESLIINAGKRILTRRTKREANIDTVWTTEHLLKDTEDFEAWINLPRKEFGGEAAIQPVLDAEKAIGDTGIAMIEFSDPLCDIASLFDLADYTVIALTEQELFHKALEKVLENKLKEAEAIAKALPGRLWRIYGPEYACPPYLPPRLFKEYVVRYVTPVIDIIKKYGGYVRLHVHGNIKEVLDYIVETGCIGLDPIEPPPQGNVSLSYVRQNYGKHLTLFGNLELSDIEMMDTKDFEKKVITALEEGTSGTGRGFVLMPSSIPIGRKLNDLTLANYKKIIEVIERYYGV